MCVFENRQQDVKVTLAGEGDRRIITGSEIGFEGKKIWVALLEAPQDLAHARAEARRHRQGHPAGLEDAVPGPVARRFHPVQRPDRQLGDAPAREEGRRVHQAVLARRRRGADRSRTGNRWNTVLGDVSLPVLVRPRPARLLAAAQEQGAAVPGAGGRLPDQPRQADAAGCLHGGGRDAQHPGRRPVRAHPRPGRAEVRVQGPGDLLGARHAHPDLRKEPAESRNAPRSTRPSTRG